MFLDLHDLQTITTINVLLTLGTMEKTWNWLKSKLIEKKNGIILEKNDSDSFESVQDFIESTEHNFYTSVIYYQAFPEENAVDFLNTLKSIPFLICCELSFKIIDSFNNVLNFP